MPARRRSAAPPRPATLRDIARACGVTPATVSRILNRRPGFSASDDVRAAVQAAAARLGYRPDGMARALVQRRTGMVAILGLWPWVIDTMTVYHRMIRAAVDRLQAAGLHAAALFPHPEHGAFPVSAMRVDGALAITPMAVGDLAEVEAAGIPYVAIDGPSGPRGSAVQVDDVAAGRTAAQRLLDAGRRRLACRMPLAYRHHSVADRIAGVRAACPAAVVAEQRDPVAWLREARTAGIDAVVCYTSQDAAAVRTAAAAAGIAVPGDLAIVAFNDDAHAAAADLTVLAVPGDELGEQAAALLLAALAGAASEQRRLPTTLVARSSG